MYNNQFTYCPYYMNRNPYPVYNSNWRNKEESFVAVTGVVKSIEDLILDETNTSAGCYKLMSIESKDRGPVNFVISPETYFVNHEVIKVGDKVTGFYDANVPVILIYPPQYSAIVIAKHTQSENVTVDYFNNKLISSMGDLKLNIAPTTQVILKNNQPFNNYPGNRNLIVIFGATTKSIPAQTTPDKIIVLC